MGNRARTGPARVERLDELLAAEPYAAVWLARPSSFAWLTGGSNVVDRTGTAGVAAAGYDGETVRVITNNIETERLETEELPDGIAVESYNWYESSLAEAVKARSPKPAAADIDVPGLATFDAARLRQPLTEADIDRYRKLGTATARAVEATCREASQGDTEREVAARLRERLAVAGIESPVVLVGGAERSPRYRHPTPTEAPVGGYALVVVTAERDGLFASCTRTVAFDPPGWLLERHCATARIEATALAATRAVAMDGGTAGEVFDAIRDTYGAVGWAGEWRRHHQGGAAGFAGREWIATPDSSATVHLPMAYAWNPTVEGAKSEDTVLVEADSYETLTAGDWPTLSVSAVGYDETFERPAVLERG